MKGEVKNGAAIAATPAAGSRRVVGTIAETAAIARAGARHEPTQPVRAAAKRDRRQHRAADRNGAEDAAPSDRDDTVSPAEAQDAVQRSDRVAVPTEDADRTKAHHILAERAYAYGRSIVEAGPEPKKSGEVEIKS